MLAVCLGLLQSPYDQGQVLFLAKFSHISGIQASTIEMNSFHESIIPQLANLSLFTQWQMDFRSTLGRESRMCKHFFYRYRKEIDICVMFTGVLLVKVSHIINSYAKNEEIDPSF